MLWFAGAGKRTQQAHEAFVRLVRHYSQASALCEDKAPPVIPRPVSGAKPTTVAQCLLGVILGRISPDCRGCGKHSIDLDLGGTLQEYTPTGTNFVLATCSTRYYATVPSFQLSSLPLD